MDPTPEPEPIALQLKSLLIADRVYKDHATGKSVIAGTFNILTAPAFPWAFEHAASVYAVLAPVDAPAQITIRFRHQDDREPTWMAGVEIERDENPVEIFGPPIPLLLVKREGVHLLEVLAGDAILGNIEIRVIRRKTPAALAATEKPSTNDSQQGTKS